MLFYFFYSMFGKLCVFGNFLYIGCPVSNFFIHLFCMLILPTNCFFRPGKSSGIYYIISPAFVNPAACKPPGQRIMIRIMPLFPFTLLNYTTLYGILQCLCPEFNTLICIRSINGTVFNIQKHVGQAQLNIVKADFRKILLIPHLVDLHKIGLQSDLICLIPFIVPY